MSESGETPADISLNSLILNINIYIYVDIYIYILLLILFIFLMKFLERLSRERVWKLQIWFSKKSHSKELDSLKMLSETLYYLTIKIIFVR